MNGEWIGNRWWGPTPRASAEHNRLSRKLTLLLARADRCRASASMIRLYCAYSGAAAIVGARLDELDQRRMAA